MISRCLPILVLATLALGRSADSSETERILDLRPVAEWIDRQQSIRSIEADFVQTRALRTLRSPVTARGHFWFQAPDRFRWQVGDPPASVIIGDGTNVTVINVRKKTAERSSMSALSQQAQAPGPGLIEFPFAKSYADFKDRFEVLDFTQTGTLCHLEVLPRDAQLRRFLTRLTLEFDRETGNLLAFEAETREGSSLRNEFRNVKVNSPIASSVFDYDLGGYRVTHAEP